MEMVLVVLKDIYFFLLCRMELVWLALTLLVVVTVLTVSL